MTIIKRLLMVVLISILLYTVLITLHHPHKEYYDAQDTYIFSKGNAPPDIRSEIIQQLHVFQEGYTRRDTSRVKPFMEELFSQENTFVLGTMPNEIVIGQDRVSRLVFSDWNTWGDCTFLMDNAHISTYGDAAWISTIGYVQFDMSRFLNLPLRLSAVMVKENLTWKFKFMQFQFDLDFTFLLATIILLTIWLPVSLISLTIAIIGSLRKSDT